MSNFDPLVSAANEIKTAVIFDTERTTNGEKQHERGRKNTRIRRLKCESDSGPVRAFSRHGVDLCV